MAARAIQISLDESLLRQIDGDPEVRSQGRSAFIRKAVDHYFHAREQREIDANLFAAYQGKGDEMAAEVEDLIEAQAWPED